MTQKMISGQSKILRSLLAEKKRAEQEKERLTQLCLILTAALGLILILI